MYYYNKMNVNIKCVCNIYCSTEKSIVFILPCNHVIHEECINKWLLDNNKKCPICKLKIKKILNEENIKKSKNKQHIIDYMALKYTSSDIISNYAKYPLFLLKMNLIINRIMTAKTTNEIYESNQLMISLMNIKINLINNTKNNPIIYKNKKIEWINKKDNDCKKIIICNHCSIIDSLILYYFFQCGFIASDIINNNSIGKIIAEKCNLLIFKRSNKSIGTVEKIKNYLKVNKKLILFPQGTISLGKTLSQFRSGAFYACDTICPVTVDFEPNINEYDLTTYYFKLLSQDKINVTLTVNDFEYGPFDENKINTIRSNMAKQLNYKLSNISNKGVND